MILKGADAVTAALLTTTGPFSDAELITASRRGDRQAFGQIVRRYQGMITGLIYASCGDLHRSEDLAQETFVSAWRSLSGLREPGKLTGWLCQIARHRLLDYAKSAARERLRFKDAAQQRGEATAPPADQQALSNEERELLWKTLSEIPQPYRETLVLYYRQGQSTAEVAAATESTEENVRQRLARGRQMLREQVANLIERDLARTAPGSAFTLAVVAALPALTIQSAKAATVGAAIKGAGAAGAGTSLWFALSFLAGPLIAVWAGLQGFLANLRSAQSRREKRFLKINGIVLAILIVAVMAGMHLIGWLGQKYHLAGMGIALQSAFFLLVAGVMSVFIIWSDRGRRAVRTADGLGPELPDPAAKRSVQRFFPSVAVFASMGVLIGLAFSSGDTAWGVGLLMAGGAIAAAVAIYGWNRSPQQVSQAFPYWTLALAAIWFIVVNLKIRSWIAVDSDLSLEEWNRRVPRWAMNLNLACIFIWIEAMMVVPLWLRARNLKRSSIAPATPPATDPQ
jgi:RNA polymerase sigma factor (sigma-70 family)